MGQVTSENVESFLYRVSYEAIYEYDNVVVLNDNILKIVPYPSGNQRLISEDVRSEPNGYKVRFIDSFGNVNYRIKVTEPHKLLRLSSESVVEVKRNQMIDCKLPCNLIDPKFTSSSDLIDVDFFLDIGKELLNSSKTLDELIRNTISFVRGKMVYQEGFTFIDTEASRSFLLGKGVCQDFAHVTIGILRSMKIPARYVMGLVNDNPKVTHAWVEVKTPGGWIPIDPTRDRLYSIDYVKFAIGRDSNDTSPVKGSFISSGKGRLLTVQVSVIAE
ncbi:transglutaminase family protein [Sulfuracidifex metallicus]|uniref:transglutaminase family protein n=1 Tax=Sulfuracidifex metallicus TaxID=47303 RepID=UPI0022770551|nr:transglutaminase family protein [Sulfuracidifex metallicus]MCY0849227.1 transglutaminase family protein [Sulfuracidifex metallicus]